MPPTDQKVSEDIFNQRKRRSTQQSFDTDNYSTYQDYLAGNKYDMNGALINQNTITTQQLAGSTNPIQLPDFPQTNPAEITAAIPTTESILADFNTPTAAQSTQNNLRSDIYKSLDFLAGKDEATLKAEEAAGIPVQTKQLQELSNRFLALRNESLAIPLQIQEQFAGTGATEGGAEPIQTSKLRQNAIQSLSISAQAQALQGNIALAQQQVDRAIKLQFEPEERKLQFLKQAYEFNREDLEREDKKKADAMRISIDERTRLLETQKADATAVRNIANTAARFGADQGTISKILQTNDPDKAIELAGTFLRDPKDVLELQKLKQDMYYARLKADADLNPTSVQTDGTIDSVSKILGSNKIGAGTKTLVGTIFGVLNAAEDMANNAVANQGGKFPGVNPLNAILDTVVPSPIRSALRSQGGTESIGYINGINLKIQQWASGAALTTEQTKQVAEMTPTKNDTDAQVKIKLNNLYNFMQQQVKGSLQSEGINYEPQKVDLFAPKTLENIFK